MPKHKETIETQDYELTVTLKFTGYENFRAVSKEAAIERMEAIIDAYIPKINLPLSDVSIEDVIIDKEGTNDLLEILADYIKNDRELNR